MAGRSMGYMGMNRMGGAKKRRSSRGMGYRR